MLMIILKYDLETGEVQHDAHSLKPAYDAHGHDRAGNFGCGLEEASRAADGFAICRRAGRAAAAAPPSAASSSRRLMVTVIRPSRARCVKGNDTTPRACCPNGVAPG